MRHRRHRRFSRGEFPACDEAWWRLSPVGRRVRLGLQRRLFFWFVGTIAFTAALVALFFFLHWRNPIHPHLPRGILWLFFGFVAWAASGRMARRLARPLDELAKVAGQIGQGDLAARVNFRRARHDEIAVVGEAMNDMAERIQKQLEDERKLLAQVSHEMRTPLARLRVLLELIRDKGVDPKRLADAEREIQEMDVLVGELISNARIDFSTLNRQKENVRQIATVALERCGLANNLLDIAADVSEVEVDLTLVHRALANLLRNAQEHGGGVTRLQVTREENSIVFAVQDRGAGISDEMQARLFQPFARGSNQGEGLGLGLALVRRIAEAHGGTAFAENLPAGGAQVGFRIPA